jgi:uncharacterized protein (TIGR03382 family)
MLDDRDRRALQDIEGHLTRHDPALAARLSDPPAAARPFPTVLALCVGLYIVVPIMSLLFGGTGAATTAALFGAVILLVLLRRRRLRSRP